MDQTEDTTRVTLSPIAGGRHALDGWAGAGGVRIVQIPVEALSGQALDGLLEEFVTRDGTDYGAEERTLDDKKSAVRRQLHRGEIIIVFDPNTRTTNIILKDELRLRPLTSSRTSDVAGDTATRRDG